MRRAAKVDRNQPEIVATLRRLGFSVQPLHAVGGGVPDLLCARRGATHLIEVKDGEKPPSARKLTPDQVEWHAGWNAPVAVINSVEEAVEWAAGLTPGSLSKDVVRRVAIKNGWTAET